MNALESEFLEYQATPDDEFPAYFDEDDKSMLIDNICHQISKQIDLYSGQPHFKHLAEFARCLLFFTVIHILRAYVMRCAILYHFCSLKNVKNTHGGVLILQLY